MSLTPEWKDRIEYWKKELVRQFYLPIGTIDFKGFTTFEQLTAGDAAKGRFAPMPEGTQWGAKWEYGWFRGDVTLPESASGKRIVLELKLGGESTVYVDGLAAGNVRADWVGHKHHFISDMCLCEQGVPGKSFEILVECYAGHGPKLCDVGPVPPGRASVPEPPDKQTAVGKSTFGIWNEHAYQLWLDVSMLCDIRNNISADSLRTSEIDRALKEFTLVVDFEQPFEGMVESFIKCREMLKPAMECKNGSTMPVMYAFGHSHIDVAWLWPLAETERKCARTFSAQLAHLDKYPGYVFLQSQPHLYRMTKRLYPELYERIREKVKEGRFIPEGGMWVEPDTNITGGESLIRQFVHGKRFFREEFGVDNELMWLPDVFGYTAALPQIMKGCGIKYFSTQKIFWNYNGGEKFPYNYFYWQGIDGSEVTTFLHYDYNSYTTAEAVIKRWDERAQKDDLSAFLLPFGYGDGGGGPARDHIENAGRLTDIEGAPRVKMGSPVEFFKDMEKQGRLPVNRYVGELYVQLHRGVLTSQAKTKKGNRKSEFALREAEFWGTAAKVIAAYEYPVERMDEAWKLVLLNQFHDILPGSSIARVYEEAEADYAAVIGTVREVTLEAAEKLNTGGSGLSVFNSLSWDRKELVALPQGWAGAADDSLSCLPLQEIEGVLHAEVDMPSCGYTTIYPGGCVTSAEYGATAGNSSDGSGSMVLENEHLRVKFNNRAEICSIFMKDKGYEMADGLCNSFKMYKDVPKKFDAWDIDRMYEQSPVELADEADIRIFCSGPLMAGIRVERKINDSVVTQNITLRKGSRRLDFETTVDWRECHKLLKVAFPVNIHSDTAVHEIQFGHLKRPNHKSRPFDADRFEVANHKWTALLEEDKGAAVLNDCKYGVSVSGNSMDLTLLRAPKAPDMNADIGVQSFTYSFYAWDGSFMDSRLVREAYELNSPVFALEGDAGKRSLFGVDAGNIVIETVKPAEDGSGDVIARLYECKRAASKCTLHTGLPVSTAWQTNMLEVPEMELSCNNREITLEFRPFEIKTLRFKMQA